jgi:hypothetical protein
LTSLIGVGTAVLVLNRSLALYQPVVITQCLSAVLSWRAACSDPPGLVTDPREPNSIWTSCVVPATPPDEGLHLVNERLWAVKMTGVPPADTDAVGRERIEPVNRLLREAEQWPEVRAAEAAWVALRAVNTEPLLKIVTRLQSEGRFNRRRRCPFCRAHPE